jgi:trehalose/maltose transport system substrate-binding protein
MKLPAVRFGSYFAYFTFAALLFALTCTPVQAQSTVRILSGAVGNELDLMRTACDIYEAEHPDVKIVLLDIPHAVHERLAVFRQFLEKSSSEIDVYQIDVIWPGILAEHFIDLGPYLEPGVLDKHFPAIVENNTVDGRLVAMPLFTDAGLLYYRTDLLQKYNLDVPETWLELERAARIIQQGERASGRAEFHGFIFQGDNYEGLTCNALEWIHSNGGGAIVAPGGLVTLNNDAAKEMLARAAGWVGTISPEAVTALREENARNIWQSGKAAFMRNWPYCFKIGNSKNSVIRGRFDVSPLPAGKRGHAATLGGWQLAVSRYSKHPQTAADVALFMCSEPIQKLRATQGSFNPTIKSLYYDGEVLAANPFFGRLYDVFVNAVARPSSLAGKRYTQVSRIFSQGVSNVLKDRENAGDACRRMSEEIRKALETGAPQN